MNSIWEFLKKLLNLICHILIGIHLYLLWWFYLIRIEDYYRKWDRLDSPEQEHEKHIQRPLALKLRVTHALMNGTAIAFCIPEALLMSSPVNYTNSLPPKVQRILSRVWFGTAFILIIIAPLMTMIKFRLTVENILPHVILGEFQGVICLILTITSVICGFMLLFSSNLYTRYFRLALSITGVLGFIVGIVALIYAYHRITCVICVSKRTKNVNETVFDYECQTVYYDPKTLDYNPNPDICRSWNYDYLNYDEYIRNKKWFKWKNFNSVKFQSLDRECHLRKFICAHKIEMTIVLVVICIISLLALIEKLINRQDSNRCEANEAETIRRGVNEPAVARSEPYRSQVNYPEEIRMGQSNLRQIAHKSM